MKLKIFLFVFVLSVYSLFIISAGMENCLEKIDNDLLERIIKNPDNEYRAIVWLNDGSKLDKDVIYRFDIIPAAVVRNSGYELMEYAKKDFVNKITLDRRIRVLRADGMKIVNYNFSKDYGLSGEDIRVAVIDTGVYNHSEFGNRIIKQKCFCSDGCCFNNSIESDIAIDDHGHGTHVAGIIAGVNGIAPNASIISIKVLDSSGSGYDSDIVNGINWAVENGANVISMSFGLSYSEYTDCYELGTSLAIDNASNYVVVVVSAGNDGPDNNTISAPACVKNVIAVGSISDSGSVSTFSSRGPTNDNRIKPDLVAPGEGINSTHLNDQYRSFSGTSMSAPFVSGAATLIMEKYNKTFGYLPSPHLVKTILINSANSTERNNIYGSGILDIERALDSINYSLNDSIKNGEKIFGSSYRTTLYWSENSSIHNNLTVIIQFNNTNTTLTSGSDNLIQFWMNNSYKVIISASLTENQEFFLALNEFEEDINETDYNNTEIIKSMPEIRLWINGTEGNYTCNKGSIINITGWVNHSLPLRILTNSSVFNSSSVLINTSELDIGEYNITAYTEGGENYTENFVTHFLEVYENISANIISTTTVPTTTTIQSSQQSSGGAGAFGYSTTITTTTTTFTTSTTTSTTTTIPTTTVPKYQINEEKTMPTGFFVFENSLMISLISLIAIIFILFYKLRR